MEFRPPHLDIADKVGVRKREALHYIKLGDSYSEMSHFPEEIDSYKEYLRICREQEDMAEVGNACGRLGNVYNNVGKVFEAEKYFGEQLCIARIVGDKKQEGRAEGNLGVFWLRRKKYSQAARHFKQQLAVTQMLGDRSEEGDTYDNFGMLWFKLGDFVTAEEQFLQNLTIVKELGDRVKIGKLIGKLARVYRARHDFQQAFECSELQLRIAVEEGRICDKACAYYEMGRDLESLETEKEALECYKSSVKLFNEIRARLPSRENSKFKDEWRINLFHEFKHVYIVLIRILLKLNLLLEAVWVAEQSRAQVLADVMAFHYGIKTVELLSVAQEEWVSDIYRYISTNTVFFEIDTDAIYIWLLMPGQPVHFRSFSVDYEATHHQDATEYLQSLIRSDQRDLRLNFDTYKILFDTFICPIINLIQGDEVVIIPRGPLFMVSFAAFVGPDSKYLCESLRIRVAPSLTSLKLIADCPQGYHRKSGALIVGDPDYGGRLCQCPGAREEAEMIAMLTNTYPLIGKKATKMAVLERLNSVALVHIAAHGGRTGGEIQLAPNPIRSERIPMKEDYMLTMKEVLNARLRAQLVVLSCCCTAHGEIKAEGVDGIARAFLAAGARPVLASLWPIEDEATFEFMKSFYQHLVEGNKASEALNKAMKCLRESDKFSPVRYWAPFVLIGDDVTLKLPFAGIVKVHFPTACIVHLVKFLECKK